MQLTINGGLGNDVLIGSKGGDLINGGDGNDTALMGDGDDTFVWNPGDDSDTLEGQAGADRLLFNGANVAENMNVFANGGRVLFTRDIATVTMDLNDVETLELNVLGGNDTVTVNNLAGTDMTTVNVELAAAGGTTADGLADTIIIHGTANDDIVTATLPSGQLLVSGLTASVLVEHMDAGVDVVHILGLAGHDVIDASAVAAGGPLLTLDGGAGDDILLGGVGGDTLLGGDNDDVLLGNGGIDTLNGGLGENILIQDGTNITSGIVSVFGDDAANTITISRDGGGNILSNGVPIPGATIANTALIRVFGRGGNDMIALNETNGALPAAALYGGQGDDSLTGGLGADLIFGGIDNDTLLGTGGSDFLFAGAGDDTLTGGDLDDLAFGQAGNDTFVWNPGDDTDLNEGGSGIDAVQVNGGGGAEVFTVTANGVNVRFDRLDPAPFSLDIRTCESLVLNANGGNDSLSCTGNLAALIQITADGGAGDDTLLGSNGNDLLLGGDDNDFIDGQQGADVVFLGAGNDTFQWDPGDGSDTIEGQDGHDVVLFNGSNGSELFAFSANAQRLLFTRNLGSIVMDADGIEQFDLRTLGSTDGVAVNSLAGTDVTQVNIDLAGTFGGSSGDAAADTITINGTAAPDTVHVSANAGTVSATGLAAQVNITHSEAANDSLTVNGLGGADTLTQGPGVSALIMLTLNQ